MSLPVVQSELLKGLPGVRHAFFTRQGGVSSGLFDSLNVGRGSSDEAADVEENRARAAGWFGVMPDALNTCYQIHSARALTAEAPWGRYRPEGDGVVTDQRSVVCGALHADCAPVLIADPKARVVAAAHAGWKGALTGIVAETVAAMERLGARRADMVAAVGPCISQASYEVGEEFEATFLEADPAHAAWFAPGAPGKRQFDLPGFVLSRLAAAGVNRAEWVGRDTCAEDELFYSNRRAFRRGEPDYGRLLSAIMLD
ncbi:peptidoglycan editing factor PgeF [Caulobacter sp. NIBR1757]|uniref:peptidoglycan editing factor PgeF n=1 Tax=Caulobacter sp. NIBR1757 TaxID=3016000 RepID=UPI0022F0F4FF|nr:peptidoglycan editing factor PgeF [Caulobacter sp. NIBR1757]WGM40978.1 Polyphenol oxidase [Caulobacter sp. NIBR1757]